MPPVRTSAFLTGIIKNCIYDYVLSLLYVDTICNWFLFTTFPAGTVIYRTIIWCNMLLYCLLLGLVVITQPVIFKTFNINSTRHLLLITVYSHVVFGTGIALAIAAFIAIYVTTLASQNQTDIQQQQQQQQQIVSSTPSAPTSSPSPTATENIIIPQGAAAQQVKTYFIPNPDTVSANSQVTWNNKDIAPHTATATDGSFDTGIINVGSSGSATVKTQGSVPYRCTIHPWMNGVLQVTS